MVRQKQRVFIEKRCFMVISERGMLLYGHGAVFTFYAFPPHKIKHKKQKIPRKDFSGDFSKEKGKFLVCAAHQTGSSKHKHYHFNESNGGHELVIFADKVHTQLHVADDGHTG